MRHPSITLAIGFALAILAGSGCVSAKSLRQVVQSVADTNGAIATSLQGLDLACQSSQHDEAGLQRCRDPRDQIRASLRQQLDALKGWAK